MSALAALSYLNSYSLLSSLYIISKFCTKFPCRLAITRLHSKPSHQSCLAAPVPRPLSSFHPPLFPTLCYSLPAGIIRGFFVRDRVIHIRPYCRVSERDYNGSLNKLPTHQYFLPFAPLDWPPDHRVTYLRVS